LDCRLIRRSAKDAQRTWPGHRLCLGRDTTERECGREKNSLESTLQPHNYGAEAQWKKRGILHKDLCILHNDLCIPDPDEVFAEHNRGESGFGRDLREYALGMSAGRLLSPLLHRAYVQGQYSYAFVTERE
jgi:hypothetical protein